MSWYINVPTTTSTNPIDFSRFNVHPSFYSLYSSCLSPQVAVNTRQNPQISTVRHTSASDLDMGLITFEMATAMGTDMPRLNSSAMIKVSNVRFFDICQKNTGTFSMQQFSLQYRHFYFMVPTSGQVINDSGIIINHTQMKPQMPYKYTIFRGWIVYLLNINFSVMRAIVLNIRDTNSRITPISCSVAEWSWVSDDQSVSVIQNICTRVMPMNAREHPSMAEFVSFLLRHSRENIAVVIITPPREICHTEPAIRLSDMYAKPEDSRSIMPGIAGRQIGHSIFMKPDCYRKFFLGRISLYTRYGIKQRASAKNITTSCMNGWKNFMLGAAYGIFCLFCSESTGYGYGLRMVLQAPNMINRSRST